MLRLHAPLHARERRAEYVALPLLLPHVGECRRARAGQPIQRRRRARVVVGADRAAFVALAELVCDAPARHLQQPRLERARLAVVAGDIFRHGDARLLHDFLRLVVPQARAHRDAVDEVPVGLEKFLPLSLVAPVVQARDEALPRDGDRVVVPRCAGHRGK